MKLFVIMLLCLFLAGVAGAVSDVGLLNADKTLGYFIMPQTQAGGAISSGLVYNQKDSRGEWEIIYLAYNSPYLLTSNMTQMSINGKKDLLNLGPLTMRGILGLGLAYSPAVGGGLVLDVGAVQSLKLLDDLAIAVPMYLTIFSDGFMMDLYAETDYRPFFMNGYDLFAGFKANVRAAGSLSQLETSGTARVGTYFLLGVRTAI